MQDYALSTEILVREPMFLSDFSGLRSPPVCTRFYRPSLGIRILR